MVSIGLEIAYGKVPRKDLKWAFMRKGIPKMCINVVEDMCEGSCTSVKSMYEETEGFRVSVSVHKVRR